MITFMARVRRKNKINIVKGAILQDDTISIIPHSTFIGILVHILGSA